MGVVFGDVGGVEAIVSPGPGRERKPVLDLISRSIWKDKDYVLVRTRSLR